MTEFTSAHLVGETQTQWCETLHEGDLWEARSLLLSPLRTSSLKLHHGCQRGSAPQDSSTASCLQGIIFFTVKLGILQPCLMCRSDEKD